MTQNIDLTSPGPLIPARSHHAWLKEGRELLRLAVPLAATPVRLSDTPGEIRRRAPTPGEHTDEILGELGYSAAEIASLHEARTV